jgi:hypothetical protein
VIVGVDISTFAIHTAWIEDGRPRRWHQIIGDRKLRAKKQEDVIDAARRVRVQWPNDIFPNYPGAGHGVTDIAIEYPFGRSKDTCTTLGAILGIVTRQAPPWARVAWPSSGELRAAIGAKNTKLAAHWAVGEIMLVAGDGLTGWDEHELDALVACVGWTRVLQAQDAA